MSGCLWLFSFKMFHINLFAWLGFSLTQIYNIIKSLWQLVLQFLILRTMYCSFYIYFLTPERSFSGKEVGRHHTSCSSSPLHSGDNMTVCEADPGAGSHPPTIWCDKTLGLHMEQVNLNNHMEQFCKAVLATAFPSFNLCERWTEESADFTSVFVQTRSMNW